VLIVRGELFPVMICVVVLNMLLSLVLIELMLVSQP
jgi:hypothetical protein